MLFLIESSVILFVLILKEILFSTEITYWLQILLEILYNTDNQHKILFWISQIFNILTVNWKKLSLKHLGLMLDEIFKLYNIPEFMI